MISSLHPSPPNPSHQHSTMDYIYEQPPTPNKKILRQSSLNSVHFPSTSRISKISSLIGPSINSKAKPTIVFNDTQINQQLQQQIAAIDQCIRQYHPHIKHIKQRQQQQNIREQILQLDEVINAKKNHVKLITDEVKHLKSISSVWAKTHHKNPSRQQQHNFYPDQNKRYPDPQQNNIFKLADQLKQQRQLLLKLQHQHSYKQSKLKQVTSKCQQIEEKYVQKCIKTKQRPLKYEEFKELNQEKKKQMQQKINKTALKTTTTRPKQSSIKQMPDFVFSNEPIKTQRDLTTNKKSLKSLQNRKIIAEQALKNARKKHNNQLSQLMAKLQFLRDEDNLQLQKIRQKQEQKAMLQKKFNEQKGGAISFHLHAHHRFMSPSNQSRDIKMTNRLTNITNNTLNAKINNFITPSTPSSNSQNIDSHHFSPHRRLISSRKGVEREERGQSRQQLSKKFLVNEMNDKKGPYEAEEQRYNDYEDRAFNPKSKNSNSNKDPSTNENDSHFEGMN